MTYNYRYLDTQNSVLYNNLSEFYQNPQHVEKMTQIVAGDSRISLRIMDWFVTNYAKKYFVVYDTGGIDEPSQDATTVTTNADGTRVITYDASRRFKVFNDYKLKLKAYSKKRFDPFCRWTRLRLPSMATETTLGQLNFFKWAIENRVLEYIEAHYDAIEHDMNARNSNSKRRRSPTSTAVDLEEEADREGPDDGGDDDDDDSGVEEVSSAAAAAAAVVEVSSAKVPGPGPARSHEKTRKRREELSVSACKCIKKETVQVLVKFTQ